MAKLMKSAAELKELVAAEFQRIADDGVDRDAVVIVEMPSGWLATLRRDGPRLDESRFATVSAIGMRLASGYDLAG